MKKVLLFLFIFSVVILSSCRTRHTCPAYHNGSVENIKIIDKKTA